MCKGSVFISHMYMVVQRDLYLFNVIFWGTSISFVFLPCFSFLRQQVRAQVNPSVCLGPVLLFLNCLGPFLGVFSFLSLFFLVQLFEAIGSRSSFKFPVCSYQISGISAQVLRVFWYRVLHRSRSLLVGVFRPSLQS